MIRSRVSEAVGEPVDEASRTQQLLHVADDPVVIQGLHVVVNALAVVEHRHDRAAGLQHAIDFSNRRVQVGHEQQHAERIDVIERRVAEREPHGVCLRHACAGVHRRHEIARDPAMLLREIASIRVGSGACELREIRALAAPDFEHALPGPRLELRELVNARIERIPVLERRLAVLA